MSSLLEEPAIIIPVEVSEASTILPVLNFGFDTHWQIKETQKSRTKIQLENRCHGPFGLFMTRSISDDLSGPGFFLNFICDYCQYGGDHKKGTGVWVMDELHKRFAQWIYDGAVGYDNGVFNSIFVELENSSDKLCCFDTKIWYEPYWHIPIFLALVTNEELNKVALQAASFFIKKLKKISIQYERDTKELFCRD